MKNKITNFFNHAANAPQNTGGGNSQFLRSESVRSTLAGRRLSNTLITHESPTNHPLKQSVWKVAAMLLMVLTLGVGNAWGTSVSYTFKSTTPFTSDTVKLNDNVWLSKRTAQSSFLVYTDKFDISSTDNYLCANVATGYKITSITYVCYTGSSQVSSGKKCHYSASTSLLLSSKKATDFTYTGSATFPNESSVKSGGKSLGNVTLSNLSASSNIVSVALGKKINSTSTDNVNFCIGSVTINYESTGGTPTPHTVSYDGNGSTGGDVPTDSNSPYTSGTSVTVLGKSTLVKENCVFAGWNTAANGSGTWYDPNASFSMGSSDVTLYAQWATCINTLDFGTIASGISSPDLAKTQSNLTTNNVKHVIAGSTRYDTSSGYQGLKFRNSGDWIGFGVAAGRSVTITTQTVNSSPAVTIDFASATTLSANTNNDYAADNDKARYFRVKVANGDAVVINKITITTPVVDVTAPTLSSSNPANSATDVATSANIVLTMSENVSVLDASKFTLSGGAGSLTTASISASGAAVTIPYTGLANNTTYTLSTAAGAVEDAAHNANEAFSISFTTVAACATTITAQPEDANLIVGGSNPTLSITASNASAYSWKESSDGTSYDGASSLGSSSTYTPSVNGAVQTKYYYCEVTSSCDGITVVKSNIVTVTVAAAPTCPDAGIIYKFETKASISATTNITDNPVNITTSNYLQTLTTAGGSLTAHNNNSNFQIESNGMKLADKSKAYLILNLGACSLKAGDIVKTKVTSQNAVLSTTTSADNKFLSITKNSEVQTYTLAADVDASTIYLLGTSNGSIVYSVEIIRPAIITLDAVTNGGTAVDPISGMIGDKVVLPHAFKSGKKFKGWYTDASAGTKQADYYTISASTTLYAQFEDIPASGTMFSLALEDELKPASNVTIKNAAGFVQPQDMIQYATVSGGSAIVYNSSTNNHAIITTTPELNFAGSSAYLLITLESALAVGDVITTNISSQDLAYTTTSTRSTTNQFTKGSNKKVTITSGHALENATQIYLWAGSSSGGKLTSFVIERPAKYALAWDFGGGTCSATAGEDYTAAGSYVAGTAITYPADNTMSRDDYTFEGWSSSATVMPASTLTITAQWTAICYATAPGTISKGTVSSGTLTLNADGTPAANNTWYWQTSETGTSTSNSGTSFNVTAAGTYYVRSYYSTGNCWSDAQSISVVADDLLEHYAITYNKGAKGTGSIEAGSKVEDVAFTLSDERFTRAGYLQTGWAESDGGAKAYDLGGSYSANAAITLYPVWTALDTYTASFACSASAPAGWTFSTDESWGDGKTIAAYVCQFVAHSIGTPKTTTGDGTSDDNVAFAKNTNATATYDLGITTTVAALDVTLVGGSSSAFDQTIEYLGADGSTVKKTYTNSLSAGNWKDNAISKTDIVDDVHYIRIHGASKWVVMKDFSVQYIETRTKYNVSFAAGTGASGSMDAVKYIAGAEVTLPECTFTAPTGKEFDAWSSSDVTISNNKFTMPAGNVTITATWKDAITRYAVAYYDGESKLGEEEVENGENPADFEDYQTKSGYNFVGWYNNSDLAEAHKVTIASEVINANANYYGKWALDLQVTKIVFSNGFDAFIKNNTVKAYYMAGESVPTIVSYEGTNLKAEGGVTIDGDNIVLTGTDDSEKELTLTLEAVTPMTSYNKQTFDGTETYVKTGYTFTAERGWRISKDLEEASNKRVSEGLCRIYFFLGGGADKATLSSFENRPVKIYVNNVQTSITSVPKQTTFDIPLDPNDATNMIAIVSNGSNGDAGFYDVKLNEHVISSDASLSSLTVNGKAVDLASGELVAGVMTYNYALPYGTVDAPTVAAVANNAFAELGAITQAVSTTGTATFTVTAEDASTQAYAVKFHVSLNPKYVIYDGSTMTDIASRTYSDGTVGFSYTMGNDLPIAGDEVNATLGTKTYTHVIKGFRPDNDPTFSIVVPTGYMAKVYMVIASNSNNSTRTLFISKTATGTVDTSYGYATSNQQTELVSATSEFLFPDTYYFGTNDGVRLYELSVTLYHIDYPRDVTQGRYGTICLPNGGIMVGAAIFEMAHKTYKNDQPYKVFFDEVINGVMEAGMPYIFMPKEGVTSIAVTYTDNANASAGNNNGLYGTLDYINGEALYGKYIFSNNSIFMSENLQNWLNANRAYIVLDEVPSNESAPAPGRRRVAMGFNGEQAQEVATGLDETTNDQMINKLLINGQIFILRGEKMYDVTGKLVK